VHVACTASNGDVVGTGSPENKQRIDQKKDIDNGLTQPVAQLKQKYMEKHIAEDYAFSAGLCPLM
jgi:2-keto-4-pentenoate hydratase/2-oxohepta-3-ene-1,7-dioic acid hydratase in catechol pathway